MFVNTREYTVVSHSPLTPVRASKLFCDLQVDIFCPSPSRVRLADDQVSVIQKQRRHIWDRAILRATPKLPSIFRAISFLRRIRNGSSLSHFVLRRIVTFSAGVPQKRSDPRRLDQDGPDILQRGDVALPLALGDNVCQCYQGDTTQPCLPGSGVAVHDSKFAGFRVEWSEWKAVGETFVAAKRQVRYCLLSIPIDFFSSIVNDLGRGARRKGCRFGIIDVHGLVRKFAGGRKWPRVCDPEPGAASDFPSSFPSLEPCVPQPRDRWKGPVHVDNVSEIQLSAP